MCLALARHIRATDVYNLKWLFKLLNDLRDKTRVNTDANLAISKSDYQMPLSGMTFTYIELPVS